MKLKGLLGTIKGLSSLAKEVSKMDTSGPARNEEAINYIHNRFNDCEIDKETIEKVLEYNFLYMQLELEEMSKKIREG